MRTSLRFPRSLFAFTATVLVPFLALPEVSWGQAHVNATREYESQLLFAEWDARTRLLVIGLIAGPLLLKLISSVVSYLWGFLTDWVLSARYTRKSRRLATKMADVAGATGNPRLYNPRYTDDAGQQGDSAKQACALLASELRRLDAVADELSKIKQEKLSAFSGAFRALRQELLGVLDEVCEPTSSASALENGRGVANRSALVESQFDALQQQLVECAKALESIARKARTSDGSMRLLRRVEAGIDGAQTSRKQVDEARRKESLLLKESESLQAKWAQSREIAGQLESEKNNLTDKITQLQKHLAESQGCRDQERGGREVAEEHVCRLKEELDIREAEWASTCADLEGRVSELAARGDAFRHQLEQGRRTSDEARRTEEELRRTLRTVTRHRAKEKEAAQALEAERDSVRKELESLLSERDELLSKLNAENDLEMLRDRVDELEAQLDEARKTLTSTERTLESQRQTATRRLSRATETAAIWKRRSAALGQLHNSILRSIPMALIVTDKEDRIIRWNPRALRLLNLPQDEIVGKKLFDAETALKQTVFRHTLSQSRPQTELTKPCRSVIRYKGSEREVIYVVTTSPLRVTGDNISGRLVLIERSVKKPALNNELAAC